MIERFDIAGYCRISVDEDLDRDNTSIENQKAIIEEFISLKFPGSNVVEPENLLLQINTVKAERYVNLPAFLYIYSISCSIAKPRLIPPTSQKPLTFKNVPFNANRWTFCFSVLYCKQQR